MAADNVLMNIVAAPSVISVSTLELILFISCSSSVGEAGRRLSAAARAGDTALVRGLLARGAPLAADWLGAGPLHAAAAAGHADTVAALLRGGASRDARTKVERTPLHLAACAGHAAAAAALLRAGADPHARDLLRMTPLHWAAERAHAPVVALLLRHGADPTAVSKFLKTPLALAARRPTLANLMEEAIRLREAAPEPPLAQNSSAHRLEASPSLSSPEWEAAEATTERVVAEAASKEREAAERANDVEVGERAETAGAALLRRHGITLLPPDTGGTVLSALQAGRRVALSAAGRRLLRDSAPTPTAAAAVGPVLLTATPVSAPPAPGVKVFTLNSNAKLVALPKEGSAATTTTTTVSAAAAGERRRTARPVKIVLNRANFTKLAAAAGGSEGAGVEVGEAAALAAAKAEAATLRREVAALRARLAHYESASMN